MIELIIAYVENDLSTAQTARALGITNSIVKHKLKNFSRLRGVDITEYLDKRKVLTEYGLKLFNDCKSIVARVDEVVGNHEK